MIITVRSHYRPVGKPASFVPTLVYMLTPTFIQEALFERQERINDNKTSDTISK